MHVENWLLVTNELIEVKKNCLKFKTLGKLPIVIEEFIEYRPILQRKIGRYQHVINWTWKHWDIN